MKDNQLDHGNYTMCKICIPRRPAGRSLYSPVGALAYASRACLGYLLRETCRAHESRLRRTLRRKQTPGITRRCARSEDLVRLEALPRVSMLHDLIKERRVADHVPHSQWTDRTKPWRCHERLCTRYLSRRARCKIERRVACTG